MKNLLQEMPGSYYELVNTLPWFASSDGVLDSLIDYIETAKEPTIGDVLSEYERLVGGFEPLPIVD